ncbi:hypothetical protein L3Q82_018437 [Scortum barcoo]|uniref:Uncharacterized protein n=1 Tax=Scortum barcoo TaxID=214431 RepID=A0ACB8VJH1_9TELE|nr:hypothetical protein L3Q82_018437 [Scortum barcoo]
MKTLHDTPIKCHDIFKALPDQQKHIRVVLTNGIAGALEKPSQCRSSLWTGQRVWKTKMSVCLILLLRSQQSSWLSVNFCSSLTAWMKSRLSLDFYNSEVSFFCWITATVLDHHMLTTDQRGELPKTLTDLYSHFLLVQTKRKKQKYDEGHETSPQELMEADRKLLEAGEAGEAGV